MIAAALALGAEVETREQRLPWAPTWSERFELLCAMERYAAARSLASSAAVMTERLRAADDMDQIITRVVLRACDEIGKVGTK